MQDADFILIIEEIFYYFFYIIQTIYKLFVLQKNNL